MALRPPRTEFVDEWYEAPRSCWRRQRQEKDFRIAPACHQLVEKTFCPRFRGLRSGGVCTHDLLAAPSVGSGQNGG